MGVRAYQAHQRTQLKQAGSDISFRGDARVIDGDGIGQQKTPPLKTARTASMKLSSVRVYQAHQRTQLKRAGSDISFRGDARVIDADGIGQQKVPPLTALMQGKTPQNPSKEGKPSNFRKVRRTAAQLVLDRDCLPTQP